MEKERLRAEFERCGGILYYEVPDCLSENAELMPFEFQSRFVRAARRFTNHFLDFMDGYHNCGIYGQLDRSTGSIRIYPGMSFEMLGRLLKTVSHGAGQHYRWAKIDGVVAGRHPDHYFKDDAWFGTYAALYENARPEPSRVEILQIHASIRPRNRQPGL